MNKLQSVFQRHDVGCQHVLEHLSLILMCRETECGQDHIALVEPARGQRAQHRAHKLILELRAAQFLQHDVALLDLSRLQFVRLYAEGLALAYHP